MTAPSLQSPVPNLRPPISNLKSQIRNLLLFASDIKIAHTVFALPFALLSTFLAAKIRFNAPPPLPMLGLILLCMITARTVAMAANRLLDARLDSLNPRTAGRALPSGRLSRRFYLTILLLCTSSFILLTSFFYWLYKNPWPLVLSVPVLLYISVYPLLKRFSRLCHYYLGAALGLAPICAWLAVTPHLILPPLLMAAAVLLWTAGFDIIYACQDYQSDLETGVISIPVRLGLPRALWLSRLTHLLSLLLLIALGFSTPYFSTLYFTGVTAAAVLLIIEHALVRPQDLTKVGLAFFTMNGLISLLLGALGMLDLFF